MKVPDEIETAGDAVRWAREQQKMTLRELARRAGFQAAYVSDIEHNRRHGSEALEKLAVALCVEPFEFTRRIGVIDRKTKEFFDRHHELVRKCRCSHCLIIRSPSRPEDGTP